MTDYSPYLEWIDRQRSLMVQQVEQWSRINSGSFHSEGLARMCETLREAFALLDGEMTELTCEPMSYMNASGEMTSVPLGKALHIVKRPDASVKIFLCGHMDTVYPKDHPFQEPRLLDANRLSGPGVADLKGGLAVMLTALLALERSPWADAIGWEILINPDEEIGSPGSARHLDACARRNHFGLLYEPALPHGGMAAQRKGSGNFAVVVKGRAAHAGREFHDGRNAIVALAEYIQSIYALNGQMEGVTINPGKIEGGGPVNMVPDLAILHFNTRMATQQERHWIEEQLAALDTRFQQQDGISIQRHGGISRPPKLINPANEHLIAAVTQSAQMLGLTLSWQATGGCCDGNNLAASGLPNVDTMGVRGGNIHSEREYVLLDSLTERAKLSALLLMRLADGEVKITTS